MKYYTILMLAMLVALQAFSQKKEKKDQKDLMIDSLTQANNTLSGKLDSLSKELKPYYGLYTTIKEKVLKRDFDPASLSHIIDSLAAKRDSAFAKAVATASLVDSISVLKREISNLTEMLGSNVVEEQKVHSMTNQLKQLKELLDANILTQTEYEIIKRKLLEKLHY